MCGIIGKCYRNGGYPILSEHELETLSHRGPDGRGIYHDEFIALGHSRLSIIDLTDSGHQPMQFDNGRYIITYNGEIYNYLELRRELEGIGEIFVSHSDTEVLLVAYSVWGDECVSRLRGMFAFAIWDTQKRTLFLARDRCGEKPLIYWCNDDQFIFASEFKALIPILPERPSLNLTAVDQYLHYQCVQEPGTLLQDVKKLPAGHHLTIYLSDEKITCELSQYWNIEDKFSMASPSLSEHDIAERIKTKLEEAIILTLRSDVPVGLALSGGIDSGAIAALAQKHYPQPMHAFSVGYPGRPAYDERDQAKELAQKLGLIYHEVEIPIDDFVGFFPEFVKIMDEPIADIAAFGHFYVPKMASDLGIKVLLTGIGGDEIFWGYQWTIDAVATNLGQIPLDTQSPAYLNILKKIHHIIYGIKKSPSQKLIRDPRLPSDQLFFFSPDHDFWPTFFLKEKVYGPSMVTLSTNNPFVPTDIGLRNLEDVPIAIEHLLFNTWLVSNCLNLGDRVSMAVGVETRLPFLDYELIELVVALRRLSPDHLFGQKARLKAALKDVLPKDVLQRPKRGFQPPVIEWMGGVVKAYSPGLADGYLSQKGIIDKKKVDDYFQEESKDWTNLFFKYKLVLLEMWCREFLN